MRQIFTAMVFVIVTLYTISGVDISARAQQLQIIANDPVRGPICAGPLGPGPCALVQQYLMQRPAPPVATTQGLRVVGNVPGVGPICNGPLGPGPCAAVEQYLAQLSGRRQPERFDPRRIEVVSVDPSMGAICNGPLGPGPCALLQQSILDRIGSGASQLPPLPNLDSVNAQNIALECRRRAGVDVTQFASCAGLRVILSPRQQTIVECGLTASDTPMFAECAASQLGIRLSDDQQLLAGCAMRSQGDESDFLDCAGTAIINNNLTPDQRQILTCAETHADDAEEFAKCSALRLLGAHATEEQRIALQCAAQSKGDYGQMAACAGANLFNLNLNPEQQIAVQCVASTGGQPYV